MTDPRPRRPRHALCAVALLYLGGGCVDLVEVEPNICGNKVYEPDNGEDCDGVAPPGFEGATCGPAESTAACRFTCEAPSNPDGGECPPGWGCGNDGVCRQAVAEYDNEQLPGEARAAGDLDGDGLVDVVLRDNQGDVKVAFFSEGRNLAELFVAPSGQLLGEEPAIFPIVANLTNDNIPDLALPVISDDVTIRVLTGSAERSLANPFVELITIPFVDNGDLEMLGVFNAQGVSQGVCDAGGCSESLAFAKRDGIETKYAILDDRSFVSLFRLELGRRQQSWTAGRFDEARSCDVLAVSFRYADTGSPGNRADLYPLCREGGGLNFSTELFPLGPVESLASVSVSGVDSEHSLVLAGSGDVDGDGRPDLLINVTDNDPTGEPDDYNTYVLFGTGDGHFNARADGSGVVDEADATTPLIRSHSWRNAENDPAYEDRNFRRLTWPRAVADINGDARADMLLSSGIVVLSTPNPADRCVLDGEILVQGPPLGVDDEAQWGYACLFIAAEGLVQASGVDVGDIVRDYSRLDSLARSVELRRGALPGFAGIAKDKQVFTGSETDHSETDFLDLLWTDEGSGQLVLQSLAAERFEGVAAGDVDGDFENDLVIDDGERLQAILGAPFELSRATSFSPVGFDQLELFREGQASASIGAERDGRLTVLRNGQWPALALLEPGECESALDCHVRFAAGSLSDPAYFAWGLGVVRSSDGGGLRVLRPAEGLANFGPAYDSAINPLVPLTEIGISVPADQVTVVSVELGGEDTFDEDGNLLPPTEEVVVIGRVISADAKDSTEEGLEFSILNPVLRPQDEVEDTTLCSTSVPVEVRENVNEDYLLCYERVNDFFVPGQARAMFKNIELDPFIEVADADEDGDLDLTWVTNNNTVVVLPSDGSGSLEPSQLIELSLAEEEEDPEPGAEPQRPVRIDWARWIEIDGSPGPELFTGDYLSDQVWALDVGLDIEALASRGYFIFFKLGERPGIVADFDGDGIDDLAVGSVMLFGKRARP